MSHDRLGSPGGVFRDSGVAAQQQNGQRQQHEPAASERSGVGGNVEDDHRMGEPESRRGVKRTREEISNCDCDNVYIPLSKKINGLNIERGDQAGGGSVREGSPSSSTSSSNLASFQESYPYDASSTYYESNHLLYHLHMERSQRQQQQQQQHRQENQ